jgi:hypothetical protein
MHMRGTRTENEVEIYAINLANKTKCMSMSSPLTRGQKRIQFQKRCTF